MTMSRRRLLTSSAGAGLAIAVAGSVDALFTNASSANELGRRVGYGPLVPDPKGLLDLPRGFSYRVLSREGDALSGGAPVPSRFDGMGFFSKRGRPNALVRNHECRADAPIPVQAGPEHTYDPGGKGGTSTLILDGASGLEREYPSLGGTAVNCAGGVTPWGTWLTCEETEDRAGTGTYTKDHGFIFEVDPYDQGRNTDPTPLGAMGRFAHEAICVDPKTGVVYETEDAFQKPFGCYYRFHPNRPLGGHGSLRAGGKLEAMRVPGVADLSMVTEPGTVIGGIEWVEVPDPLATTTPTRLQDYGPKGITHAQKLEGAWWGDGGAYFVSSYARVAEGSGAEHDGQVWRYDPKRNRLTLEVVFTRDQGAPADQLLQTPDNICVSPFGGLMIAEDGDGENYVVGVSEDGEPYLFANNRQNIGSDAEPEYSEFAGVVFSDDGSTLYVNCYRPGTTFAITGPWGKLQ
ncbi:MAG: alkaline phosphatase PhoX [Micromonosporaceae bacterium]